jgi:hypothetical protein
MLTTLCVFFAMLLGLYGVVSSRERRLIPLVEFGLNILYIPSALLNIKVWNAYDERHGPYHDNNRIRHRFFQLHVGASWIVWTMGFLTSIMYARGSWDYHWVWIAWGCLLAFWGVMRFAQRHGTDGLNFAMSIAGVGLATFSISMIGIALVIYLVADPIFRMVGAKLEEVRRTRDHP